MASNEMLQIALGRAVAALELIAMGPRPDGTYNRSREACEQLAKDALATLVMPAAAPQAAPPEAKPVVSSGSVVVYTDGGCKGNPGPSGWGVVVVDAATGKVLKEASGFIGHATNQVAELVAAMEGLSCVAPGTEVTLISDSQYTIKGLNEWRRGWERNGWMTSGGSPVANQAHWKRLCAVVDQRKVSARWVRGHNGDVHNERCDALASAVIAKNSGVNP